MNTLSYLSIWLALAGIALCVLAWLAHRAPLIEDGWQEHDSGRCPVEPLTTVDLQLASGEVIYRTMAGMWFWSGNQGYMNIVAYRVCEVQA